jgi:hypothetical protein
MTAITSLAVFGGGVVLGTIAAAIVIRWALRQDDKPALGPLE